MTITKHLPRLRLSTSIAAIALPLSLALLLFAPAGCASQGNTSAGAAGQDGATDHPGGAARDGAETALWLYAMDAGGTPLGPGSLEVSPADLDDRDDGQRIADDAPAQTLELASLTVSARTVGNMARYEVEHVFENPGDATLEGTFRFPLPHGAIVTGLAMEIDGQLMDGEILERSKAREIYEEIVDSMRDPALLEWEAGQTFKLRVFPIAPGEKKRVVMRYMAPLVPDAQAKSGFALEVPTARPALQTSIARVQVRVDGRERLSATQFTDASNLRFALDDAPVPATVQELAGGQRYLAARLDLDWSEVPAPPVPDGDAPPRRTVIVVDSSRSALESWPLAREAVAAVLGSLDEGALFTVLTADLEVRDFRGPSEDGSEDGSAFVANDIRQRAAALAHLELTEPDGASDLGATLTAIEALLAQEAKPGTQDQVIYIGDGTPTWGLTDTPVLAERARASLHGAPLYALSLGKRDSRDVLEALSGATGGRTLRPRTPEQVHSFTRFLERAPSIRRIGAVHIEVPGLDTTPAPAPPPAVAKTDTGTDTHTHTQLGLDLATLPALLAPVNTTWFEGERPVVHLRLAADAPVPTQIQVHGVLPGGESITRTVMLGEVQDMDGVRQQWVAHVLRQVSDKATAVELSVEHSVLSKHTALLVLESEEAYERYAIERRAKRRAEAQNRNQNQNDPTISGRDLDGDGAAPYLGPGDLQPGDPEVHIPAPRDAREVNIIFPSGDIKAARWEEELGQWTVRFLVDDDVESGIYKVRARITHADGRVELLELEYTVDVQAPTMRLELRVRGDGAYDVVAIQELTEADAAREAVEGVARGEEASSLDSRRVELLMPDGQTLTLRRGQAGRFIKRWEPRGALSWPLTIPAVVADRALNSQRVELVVAGPVEGGR